MCPVPSVITDLSTSAASNSPAGGDSIGTSHDDYMRAGFAFTRQLFNTADVWSGTAGGTANALTLTPSPAITAYVAGQSFTFKAGASPSTSTVTLAISGLSTIAIQSRGAALSGGEIQANQFYRVTLDTTSTAQLERIDCPPNGQIPFPATQNASSDANTLDDYEEGTWTPAITFSTPGDLSVAYSTQVGRYTKIGNLVTLDLSITTSTFTHTTASGAAFISGLPFTAASTGHFCGALLWQGITKASYTDVNLQLAGGGTQLEVVASGSGQSLSSVAAADMPTAGTVILRGTISHRV